MADRLLTKNAILALLAETPRRIEALTSDMPRARLQTAPSATEWSPTLVLAHLRSCADVWIDCIVTTVLEDHPTLQAVNPNTWIKSTDYCDLDFARSWRSYAQQRADLLAFLEELPDPAWSRSATVTGAGPVRERTVHFYAQWLATHERSHLKQFHGLLRG